MPSIGPGLCLWVSVSTFFLSLCVFFSQYVCKHICMHVSRPICVAQPVRVSVSLFLLACEIVWPCVCMCMDVYLLCVCVCVAPISSYLLQFEPRASAWPPPSPIQSIMKSCSPCLP